jgi:hypothetical protein
MIRLHQSHSEFINGKYQTLANNNEKVFSFSRKGKTIICVAVNFSDQIQQAAIDISGISAKKQNRLWGKEKGKISGSSLSVGLPAYCIEVWQIY